METKVITVPNISCGHCTAAIEEEISDLSGVSAVSAEESSKQVTIQFEAPATWQAISETLTEIGYPAA